MQRGHRDLEECTNFAGQPTKLQSFGGTSESAPFIAGGAALIVQAYRDRHGPIVIRSLSPSPAQSAPHS